MGCKELKKVLWRIFYYIFNNFDNLYICVPINCLSLILFSGKWRTLFTDHQLWHCLCRYVDLVTSGVLLMSSYGMHNRCGVGNCIREENKLVIVYSGSALTTLLPATWIRIISIPIVTVLEFVATLCV